MKTTSLMAGASRFAHFAGLTRSSRRAAENDDSDKKGRRADEDEDEDGKGASAEDDGEPKGKRGKGASDDDEGKQGRRAADDDDDDDGKGASDDDEDDQPKGKRGKGASDDDDDKDADDDDDEMKGKGATAQARRREQSRISHILGHKAAAANPVLAVSLACDTRMTRREAVAVLESQPAGGTTTGSDNRHSRRDRQDRNVALGSDASQPTGKQAVNASWDAAFKRAGIKTR